MVYFFCHIAFVYAEQLAPAHSYTDQQLLQAGWTALQITQLRATTPKKPADNIRSREVEVPPYRSVFDDYKSFEYLPDTDWRKANDEVGRIGGWRSYLRQVQEAQKQEAMSQEETNKEKKP